MINNTDNINYQYNPRASVPDYNKKLLNSKKLSDLALSKLNGKLDVRYGEGELQTLDVFYKKNTSNMPVHIFIHGGYWRALDKSYHTHMAVPFYEKNIVFFNLNYDLCPNVKLSTITNQIIQGIIWIVKNGHKFNADLNNIVLSGHSAGAHLASLVLSTDWKKKGIDKSIFKGVSLISGIYDTELVLGLDINKEIKLSHLEAVKNNIFIKKPKINVPVIIAYGGDEPKKWIEQSTKYQNLLKKYNINSKLVACPRHNHFSLIDMLADKNNRLVKMMLELSNIKKN